MDLRNGTLATIFLLGALPGCSSRAGGSSGERAPRPALGAPIDRIGRALTGNALIEPLGPDDVADRRKEAYNRAPPAAWPQFADDFRRTLGLYDSFDGICGNQWLADAQAEPARRAEVLARTFADDRLWINSASATCTQYLAVEQAALAKPGQSGSPGADCGGRTPAYDAVDVFRSLLVQGTISGVEDGIARDDRVSSTVEFPFLAAP